MQKLNLIVVLALLLGSVSLVGAMSHSDSSEKASAVVPVDVKDISQDDAADDDSTPQISMNEARALYKGDSDALAAHIQALEEYCDSHKQNGYTHFDFECLKLFKKASAKSAKEVRSVQGIYFIEVDGVVLSDIKLARSSGFKPIEGPYDASKDDLFYTHRMQAVDLAHEWAKDLCAEINRGGDVVVLISGRRSWKLGLEAATRKNLEQEHIVFDELCLVPEECNWTTLGDAAVPVNTWMARYRAEVSMRLGLPIIACIGCSSGFFVGGNTGMFVVKTPDYFCLRPTRPVV